MGCQPSKITGDESIGSIESISSAQPGPTNRDKKSIVSSTVAVVASDVNCQTRKQPVNDNGSVLDATENESELEASTSENSAAQCGPHCQPCQLLSSGLCCLHADEWVKETQLGVGGVRINLCPHCRERTRQIAPKNTTSHSQTPRQYTPHPQPAVRAN